MNKTDLITKVIVPTMLAAFSVFVAIYLARDRAPAELVLERISIVPTGEEIDDYGGWQLTALPDSVYQTLRPIRPRSPIERSSSNEGVNCFDSDEPWNQNIPWEYLCGDSMYGLNAYLLNTDGKCSEHSTYYCGIEFHRRGALVSNSLGISAYYLDWRWNSKSPGDDYRFLLSESEIAYWQDCLSSRHRLLQQALWSSGSGSPSILALQEKLNAQPVAAKLRVALRNVGDKDATMFSLFGSRIISRHHGAGGGGTPLSAVNEPFSIVVTYDRDPHMDLPSPVLLEPASTTLLEFDLVLRGAGDGPGEMLFDLWISYFDNDTNRELLLGNFLMHDAVDLEDIHYVRELCEHIMGR